MFSSEMISLHRSHVLLLQCSFLQNVHFWVKQCPSIARSSNAVSLKHNAFRDMRSLSKPITLWKCQMTIFQFFGIFSCSSSTCRADPSKNTLQMGELLCNSPTCRADPSKNALQMGEPVFCSGIWRVLRKQEFWTSHSPLYKSMFLHHRAMWSPILRCTKAGFWKSRCVCFSCVQIDRLKSD